MPLRDMVEIKPKSRNQAQAKNTRRVRPSLYLHRGIATEGAVSENNVADVTMATVAVWDRANAGTVPVGEVNVLDQHAVRVVLEIGEGSGGGVCKRERARARARKSERARERDIAYRHAFL